MGTTREWRRLGGTVVGEPEPRDVEQIVAYVDARKLLGHTRHPEDCTCIQCGMHYPATTDVCPACGKPSDNHAWMYVAQVKCPEYRGNAWIRP